MANCLFCHPNLSDIPVGFFSGAVLRRGSWVLPLSNAQSRVLSRVARSDGLSPIATQFDVEFLSFGEIRVIALVNHNFSVTARLKITSWYDDGSYYDNDYQVEVDVYPTIGYTEDLPSEAENWWDGKPLSRDIQGLTQNAIHVLPAPTSAPNWRIEIIDPNNPAGYVQFGRLWMATGWQPSYNYNFGGNIRFVDNTRVEAAISGAEYFEIRKVYRVADISIDYLPQQEAFDNGFELNRRAGIHGEFLFIADPEDAINLQRLSFLARFQELREWEQVSAGRASGSFQMKELL